MLPTLRSVLELPAVARGVPKVVAGRDHLDARVRWVHVSELTDIGQLLRGGELVLTTGIALPDSENELGDYVRMLAAGQACGLIVEMGRRYVGDLPSRMREAADVAGLPLIVLQRPTPFLAITEAVHALIINDQYEALRASEDASQVLTQLVLQRASIRTVVKRLARLANCPIVLENLAHQIIAYELPEDIAVGVLSTWSNRARRVAITGRTEYVPELGWLVTLVGPQSGDWGRLIFLCEGPPQARLQKLAEYGASILVLSRMLDSSSLTSLPVSHRAFLRHLAGPVGSSQETYTLARALSLPTENRDAYGLFIKFDEDHIVTERSAYFDNPEELVGRAANAAKVVSVTAALGGRRIAMLLLLPRGARLETIVDRLISELPERERNRITIAVGTPAESVQDWPRTFQEAARVADTVPPLGARKKYYTLADIGLNGLLALLRDDERLQQFVETELGPLLAMGSHADELLHTLRIYFESGRSKSAASEELHLSRPALYRRLEQASLLLGRDVDDSQASVGLHVALLAHQEIKRERLPWNLPE